MPMISSPPPAVQTRGRHPDGSILRALREALADRLMRVEAEAVRDEYRPSMPVGYEPSEEDQAAYLDELTGGRAEPSRVEVPRETDGYPPGYSS